LTSSRARVSSKIIEQSKFILLLIFIRVNFK